MNNKSLSTLSKSILLLQFIRMVLLSIFDTFNFVSTDLSVETNKLLSISTFASTEQIFLLDLISSVVVYILISTFFAKIETDPKVSPIIES